MSEVSSSNNQLMHQAVGFPDVVEVIWRRKLHLAGCVLVSLGLGTVYLFQTQPTYKVDSRVLVQPENTLLDAGGAPRREKEFLATQGEIISSPAVVQRAVDSLKIPLIFEADTDPVLHVLGNLTVKPLAGTNVLSVTYRCKNSEKGIGLVEAILTSYEQLLQEMNDDSRLEAFQMLARSEERLRVELEGREQRYRELRKKSPVIGQGNDATAFQTTILEELGQALATVRSRRIDLQNRSVLLAQDSRAESLTTNRPRGLVSVAYSAPAETASTPTTAYEQEASSGDPGRSNTALELVADLPLAGSPGSTQILEELYRAEVRQKELAEHCGPDHPAMRSVQRQIIGWEARLDQLKRQAPAMLNREIAAAQSRESQLMNLYDKEFQKAKASDEFLVVEKQELDGIDRLKTIHNSLVAQVNDWRLSEPGDDSVWGTRMAIIEAPSIGAGPIWPKPSMLLALCVAVGLLGGVGLIAVLERRRWSSAFDHAAN